MNEFGIKAKNASIASLGLENVLAAYWNLNAAELVEETLVRGEGVLTDTGALAVDTGEFTGRSPKDKFIVEDSKTKDSIWWSDVNFKFDSTKFDALYNRMCAYLSGKEVYVRDSYACADPKFRLNIRVVTEYPWSNLFANNLFLRPSVEDMNATHPTKLSIAIHGWLC